MILKNLGFVVRSLLLLLILRRNGCLLNIFFTLVGIINKNTEIGLLRA
jgi:hypothetical protein